MTEFPQQVEAVIVDFRMPFWSMVAFLVKLSIAAIPAIFILAIISGFVVAIVGGIGSGLSGHH